MNKSAAVLIADDDLIILKMLDESLRIKGYNTITVMDGERRTGAEKPIKHCFNFR